LTNRETATVPTFTGRKRRTTRKSVKVIDLAAKIIICAGGICVTLALAGIVAFLALVAIPLFRGAQLSNLSSAVLAKPAARAPLPVEKTERAAASVNKPPAKPLAMGMDENLASVWVVDSQGDLSTYLAAGGELLKCEPLGKQPVTAISNNQGNLALGFADGSVRAGRVGQSFEYLDPKALAKELKPLAAGQVVAYKGGAAALTDSDQVRVARTTADLSEPLAIGRPASPIVAVDYLFTKQFEALVAMRADGRLFFDTITKKENLMTGKTKRSVKSYEFPVSAEYQKQRPAALLMGLNGRLVFVVYPDGKLVRYNTDDPQHASVVEVTNLLRGGAKIAAVRMLLGNQTLIVTDTDGGVAGWFPVSTDGDEWRSDVLRMVKAHELEKQAAPIVAIGTSSRDRQFVTCDAKGEMFLRHMTSGQTQGKLHVDNAAAVAIVAMSPKNDAIAVLDESRGLTLLGLSNPHPDGSLAQMFLPVWYEGYGKPGYVYQSSAATDDAEPKMSLIPLIFGTIKATFYAMLFAVPIAVMSAIYTSEFMQPQARTVVKPLVEMMASLPSVVLGFIAALVLAPIVENAVMAVLMAFVAIPVGVAAFGFVWQLLPVYVARAVPSWAQFGIMLGLVLLAGWCSFLLGPAVESLLFSGDIKDWLAGRVGTATPGWAILLTPFIFLIGEFIFNKWIKYSLAGFRRDARPLVLGAVDLGLFLLLFLIAAGLATAAGSLLSSIGWDLRGSIVGSYVQRNTLIVGMIMGFAIIPIIYTVSEDALSSVPDSLRAAALGAGATPWQTAIRVILPVAGSGIFSACMIGFGRAAGETMIVLMGSGRMPIIDINIFTGLSALSANIATELPEAPKYSTHFRVLFMSALVLFVLTFVVNTTAEIVRLRFRKRAHQL
jgi:phosphate transport system permease protein